MIKNIFYNSLKVFLLLTLITGIIYPLLVTGFGKIFFPSKSGGSLIYRNNEIIGSELIGQKFSGDKYFHGRPSINGYNTMPSSGSNYPVSGKAYRLKSDSIGNAFRIFNNTGENIPGEMITYSASSLDPHISKEAALLQVERISRVRSFDKPEKEKLLQLINENILPPQLGFLGEERLNVFKINLEIDNLNYGR